MKQRLLRTAVAILLVAAPPSSAQTPDTSTTSFQVGALRVIHRRLTTNNIVVAQVYLLGGTRQVTADDAGIEVLMLDASRHGSKKYPGNQSEMSLAKTGSTIGVSGGHDWSVMELRTVRSELDSAWSVFADRIVAPELTGGGVSLARDRMYVAATLRLNDPDEIVRMFASMVAFRGHPYALEPYGTERSMRLINSTAVQAYHKAEVVTSRMLLVVVGNATRAEIERLASGTLAALPEGRYIWALPPELPVREASMRTLPRQLATNYILGFFPGPPTGSRDHAAFRVATALLGARIHWVVREERQLSYAAYAPFLDRAVASGGVYASTTQPEKVMKSITELMTQIVSEEMEWASLPRFVSQFAIEHLLEHETYSGQAEALAQAHLLRGDFRQTGAWLKDLRGVSPIRLQLVARKYFPKIQYVYVGDTAVFRAYLRR